MKFEYFLQILNLVLFCLQFAMASATKPGVEVSPELPTTPLEDLTKPDTDTDFEWPDTPESQCWSLFLQGTYTHLVKPSSVNNWIIDFEALCDMLKAVIIGGSGIQLVNTIGKVHDRGIGIVKESLIFGVAICSCSSRADVKTKAFDLMQKVCAGSMNFLIFIDFRERIHRQVKQTTGWSHALRNAVKKWYRRYPPIQMARIIMECPRHNKWSHKDVLALTHIAPSNNEETILFSYIVAGLRKTTILFKNDSPDEDDEAQKVLQFLEDVTTVRSAQTTGAMVQLMDKLKLSWNFVPISLYRQAELWEQMIMVMPFEIMLENATRMAKLKVLQGNSRTKEKFIARCEDNEAIKESGIHPFEIFAQRETYRDGVGDVKRKPRWLADTSVTAALQTAMLSAMKTNLKSTGKRYFVTIDASDSMKAHVSNYDRVQCRSAAAFLSLCIAKAENKVIVKAFGLELPAINIDPTTTVDDIVKLLDAIPLGGCDCARPIIYAKKLKVKVDVFVMFTDRETWCGKTSPVEALKQYRAAVKIPAKLVVVFLNPDNSTRAKRMSGAPDRGILEIYGISTSMLQAIGNFAIYPY